MRGTETNRSCFSVHSHLRLDHAGQAQAASDGEHSAIHRVLTFTLRLHSLCGAIRLYNETTPHPHTTSTRQSSIRSRHPHGVALANRRRPRRASGAVGVADGNGRRAGQHVGVECESLVGGLRDRNDDTPVKSCSECKTSRQLVQPHREFTCVPALPPSTVAAHHPGTTFSSIILCCETTPAQL